MPYPALNAYLARLSDPGSPGSTLWLNAEGQAEGRFFNSVLTSAFQPIVELRSGHIGAYEAVTRGVDEDAGRSLWRMQGHAASDDESVELDRLCRMLHAINFFRQPAAEEADLFLSVHDRLLSAVSSNHGQAFRRILDALELPVERVVLQLPAVNPTQTWLLGYVTDNYRLNGFRMALHARSREQAAALLVQVRPSAIKVDASALGNDDAVAELLSLTHRHDAQLIVKRVQSAQALAQLERVSLASGLPLYAQGISARAQHMLSPAAARH